jgi:hypothetical protein
VKADLKRIFCRVWHFHVAGVSSICQVEALALSASELAEHVKRLAPASPGSSNKGHPNHPLLPIHCKASPAHSASQQLGYGFDSR